jgi:uncharacterized integral membrane protein
MNLLAALLLGHLIGDFPLQTNQIYRLKNKSWLGIVLHAVVHVVITALLICQPLSVWPLFVYLGVLHFLIDLLKLRLPINPFAKSGIEDKNRLRVNSTERGHRVKQLSN